MPEKPPYILPAEWDPQESTWLCWPANRDTWDDLLPDIQKLYRELITLIRRHQSVCLVVPPEGGPTLEDRLSPEHSSDFPKAHGDVNDSRENFLRKNDSPKDFLNKYKTHPLHLIPAPANDCWIRDSGALTLMDNKNGNAIMHNWTFNAWGQKYAPWDADNALPEVMASFHGLPLKSFEPVLEGGAIDSNGEGLLLASATCLCHTQRNPGWNESTAAEFLKKALGIQEILWLHGVMEGDDTDGHVDEMARFVSRDTVVYASTQNISDPNYSVLQELERELRTYAEVHGLKLIPLPIPEPMEVKGLRVPASYVNFMFINGALILPAYGDPADETAQRVFKKLFPERKIYTLDCRELNYGQGGLHCISMQVPRLTPTQALTL